MKSTLSMENKKSTLFFLRRQYTRFPHFPRPQNVKTPKAQSVSGLGPQEK